MEAQQAEQVRDQAAPNRPGKDSVLEALKARHPWHQQNTKELWPFLRAVFDGFKSKDDKKRFLVTGDLEKAEHFDIRVKLTQFLGCSPSISERLVGRIFQDHAEVDYAGHSELERFAEDIDGTGTTLEEFLEEHAREAAEMGLVGIWVDRGRRPADAVSQADEDRSLKITPFSAEEIVDWSPNPDDGMPDWIKLQRTMTRQTDAFGKREIFIRWLILTREQWFVYEATTEQLQTSIEKMVGPSGRLELYKSLDVRDFTDRTPENNVHGAGRVPFTVLYGKKKGFLQGESLLEGAARADLAGLNADSDATFSEWLHCKPAFFAKTKRSIEDLAKNVGIAWKLNPEDNEEIGYVSTDGAGFEHQRKVIESRKLDAHRMAGADPIGLFEASAQPESGRAKSLRFSASEERVLARLAANIQAAHFDILDLCARLLSTAPVGPKERAFKGSVRYQSKFDLADAADLIEQYAEAGYYIDSESWHKDMRKRIARLIAGDVARERAAVYDQEIDAAPFRLNLPSERVDNAAAAGASKGDEFDDGEEVPPKSRDRKSEAA